MTTAHQKISVPFRDKMLAEQFIRDGYVVISLSDESLVDRLEHYINSLNPNFEGLFYYSLMAHDYSQNLAIGVMITDILKEETEQLFEHFIIRNSSFIAKPGNVSEEMFLHQDWSFTDTDNFEVGTLWIPLCDTTIENGALIVLPGSQHVFRNYISSSIQTLRIPSASFPENALKVLEVKRGQAVVFNPSVFHGSCPNLTDKVRISVTASIFPEASPFVYFKRISEDKIGRVILNDDEFLKQLNVLAVNDSLLSEDSLISYNRSENLPSLLLEKYEENA